jgi:sugar/nucleoside kinase (ribokinase family)
MGDASDRGTGYDILVAGHLCVDIIPTFLEGAGSIEKILIPGTLTEIGPATVATGGVPSNTGLALHRLGVRPRLVGKIGDDVFGSAVADIFRARDPDLAEGLVVTREAETSYTLVINPPGIDRSFLHCVGANATFGPDDVPYPELESVRLFHFGYPPLLPRMYRDDGAELEAIYRRARERGPVTALDMARPDPAAPAGKANWPRILERTLPCVDVFVPSFDEMLYMLDPDRLRRLESEGRDVNADADADRLDKISTRLLALGTAMVLLKLGDQGAYLRTTGDRERLRPVTEKLGLDADAWLGRELYSPCFAVKVGGTVGAGDCTIAGFLASLLNGLTPECALSHAVGTGAFSVEAADAISGVPTWEQLEARMKGGWAQHEPLPALANWPVATAHCRRGPADSTT